MMRSRLAFLILALAAAFALAGCSDSTTESETSESEPSQSTSATTTTAAPTTTSEASTTTEATTTTAPTTTTGAPAHVIDLTTADLFVASVRDNWAGTERTVGGTAPEMTDEEIVAIAISVCEHFAASPLPLGKAEGPRLEAYADAAAIISEAMGIPYDPELLDAGFEAEIDARNVMAFRGMTDFADEGGLCPASTARTDYLFYSPWSARASAQDG